MYNNIINHKQEDIIMGWYGCGDSNITTKEFAETHFGSEFNDKYKFAEHAVKGNVIYSLIENKTDPNDCWVRVHLISRSEGEIMYKPIDDVCLPYERDCPEKFLKRCKREGSQEYIQACRDYRLEKKKEQQRRKHIIEIFRNLKSGDVLVTNGGKRLTFDSMRVVRNKRGGLNTIKQDQIIATDQEKNKMFWYSWNNFIKPFTVETRNEGNVVILENQ